MFNILQPKVGPPWARALESIRREFHQLDPLGKVELAEVAAWLLVEHVYHDLRLDGIRLGWNRVGDLLLGRGRPEGPEERLAINYGAAIQRLGQIVSSEGGSTEVGRMEMRVDDLLELHGLAVGESGESPGVLREYEINPLYPSHRPAKPYELSRLLEVAFEWFSAESIRELHPVEQAAVVHLRLYDLQPFGKASGRLSRLAASLYTLRVGLPPIIIRIDDSETYYQALLTGFQMATQPLVELLARSLGTTLRHMTDIVEACRT